MEYKRKETENMEGLLTNGKKKFVKYEEGAAMFSIRNSLRTILRSAHRTVETDSTTV